MPTPYRTVLAQAVAAALTAALPSYAVSRASRIELAEEERPALRIQTGDADPDYGVTPMQVVWRVAFTVIGYPVAAASDHAGEDALATLEAAIIGALQNRTLATGINDIQATGSSIQLTDAETSAAVLGEVSIGFRADIWLPADSANL